MTFLPASVLRLVFFDKPSLSSPVAGTASVFTFAAAVVGSGSAFTVASFLVSFSFSEDFASCLSLSSASGNLVLFNLGLFDFLSVSTFFFTSVSPSVDCSIGDAPANGVSVSQSQLVKGLASLPKNASKSVAM
jgi:hypothetical protein